MKLPTPFRRLIGSLILPALALCVTMTASTLEAAPARRPVKPAARKAAPTPTVRTVVDRKGKLRLSAAQMRALRPQVASNGLVCLEFPLSVLRKRPQPPKSPKRVKPGASKARGHHEGDGHNHGYNVQDFPPRVWITAAADGSLTLSKTRLIPGDETVPGAPGTVYIIKNQSGRLLVRPSGVRG
jgi:hypothetical protein